MSVRLSAAALVFLIGVGFFPAYLAAGVSREIEDEYRSRFENRAMFLRVPVHGTRQVLYPREGGVAPDRASAAAPVRFRVGEQVRILRVDFNDSNVEFKLASIDLSREASILFDFTRSLTYTFARRPEFEAALTAAFTEGLDYRDIDAAKQEFVAEQFQRVVAQIAETTGESLDFVRENMLAASPEMSRLKAQLDRSREDAARLEEQLSGEQSARASSDREVQDLRARFQQAERSAAALREERDRLQEERDRLSTQLEQLQAQSSRARQELDAIAARLDVQSSSNSELGRQVSALSENIQSLQRERDRLVVTLAEVEGANGELTREKEALTSQLAQARRENRTLSGDLRALTSDAQSLESNYLRLRERKDQLELSDELAAAVRLNRLEGEEAGKAARAEVRLLTQTLGTLEVEFPGGPDEAARVRLDLHSPDTVQFSEDERRLFEALGSGLTLSAEWSSWSGDVQAQLAEGEAVRTVVPREPAEWVWNLQGDFSQPRDLTLRLAVTDGNGLVFPLGEYHHRVAPAGLAGLLSGFSLWSLGIGLVLGSLLGGGLIALTRRADDRSGGPPRDRSYSAQKSL